MAYPMRVRATLKGDIAEVRVLMNHPMEAGLRRASDGKPVPMHFIQNVTVKLNGKTRIEGETSQALSTNPVFSFRLKDVKAGDRLEIAWLDNQGQQNRTETAIA